MTAPVSEPRARVSGWLIAAVVVAVLLVGGAAAALVWARGEQDDAQRQRTRLETELAVQRTANTPDRLAATRAAIEGLSARFDAIGTEAKAVSDLQQQDAAYLQAALDAGKKGDVPAYNEAVTKRNALAPQVDAAIEKLRTDVNEALLGLAGVTNRTTP